MWPATRVGAPVPAQASGGHALAGGYRHPWPVLVRRSTRRSACPPIRRHNGTCPIKQTIADTTMNLGKIRSTNGTGASSPLLSRGARARGVGQPNDKPGQSAHLSRSEQRQYPRSGPQQGAPRSPAAEAPAVAMTPAAAGGCRDRHQRQQGQMRRQSRAKNPQRRRNDRWLRP